VPTSKGREGREGQKGRKGMRKGNGGTAGEGRDRRGKTTCIPHYFRPWKEVGFKPGVKER